MLCQHMERNRTYEDPRCVGKLPHHVYAVECFKVIVSYRVPHLFRFRFLIVFHYSFPPHTVINSNPGLVPAIIFNK